MLNFKVCLQDIDLVFLTSLMSGQGSGGEGGVSVGSELTLVVKRVHPRQVLTETHPSRFAPGRIYIVTPGDKVHLDGMPTKHSLLCLIS